MRKGMYFVTGYWYGYMVKEDLAVMIRENPKNVWKVKWETNIPENARPHVRTAFPTEVDFFLRGASAVAKKLL